MPMCLYAFAVKFNLFFLIVRKINQRTDDFILYLIKTLWKILSDHTLEFKNIKVYPIQILYLRVIQIRKAFPFLSPDAQIQVIVHEAPVLALIQGDFLSAP